jgi:hypothetical protein
MPCAGPARAQAAAPYPATARAQAPADTSRPRVVPDTLQQLDGIQIVGSSYSRADEKAAKKAHADSLRAQGWSAQPRFVMMRSLLIPGWGQVYNRAWYKAGAIAAGEVVLGLALLKDQQQLDDLSSQIDQARADQDGQREQDLVNEYNNELDQRIAHQWFLGAVLTYAMVDAYVDAHFRNFEFEFKHDPALPDGPPPTGTHGKGGGSTRLGLRWHF